MFTTSPAIAMVTADRQLVLLVDGSGSISSADWELQKQGIAAALADNASIPRDGSIAFGIVQWANNTTRVEVPLTLVDSTSAADGLITQVEAMIQIGGGTNPGDGIRAGTNLLTADGDPTGEWLLCQSTDGTRNQGEGLATSTSFAQSSGVDRYSVIAIEDGGFTRAVAQSSYGPFVFGDGTVTVARNAAEFANLLVGACLNPPLELVALEVNQAVQSWDLSVPLIAEKPTVVRAFVQTVDGSSVTTSGLLFGTRNGSPLPGSPLAPLNDGGTIDASDDVVSRRADREASLNFRLPRSWSTGDVELRLELPGGTICSEAAPPADSCTAELSHITTDELGLRVIAVTYDNGGGLEAPTNAQLTEQGLRTWTQFPISTIDTDRGVLGDVIAGVPTLDDVNVRLANMRDDECALGPCDEDAYWYGVLAGAGGGLADDIPGRVSSGFLSGTGGRTAEGYARNRGPHEVAHTLGRSHAVDGDLGLVDRTLWIFGGRKQGYCGERAARSAPDWPDVNDIGGTDYATLGPLGDDDTEIWGFDVRFARPNEPEDLAVSDPRETMPMMSYGNGSQCNLTTDGQLRWISQFTYNGLIPALQTGGSGGGGGGGGGGSWDALFISGVVDLATETVEFGNSRILPSGRVDFASTGDFTLDIYGRDGALLDSVDFEPIIMEPDQPNDDPPKARFNVPVPLPAAPVGRVDVSFGTLALGSTAASDSPPVVEIVTPATGDVLTDDDVVISWQGDDADGDVVRYSVYYSPDGGDWRGLAHATIDTSITVDRSQLEASGAGRLVVIASDGLNSSRAERELFEVVNNDPVVAVISPADDEVFSGVQSIFLEALATDREDGVPAGGLTWSSDIDGFLGSGDQVVLQATDLSEAHHVITVVATDSNGARATAAVEIDVFRIAPPRTLSLRDRLSTAADGFESEGEIEAAETLRSVLGDEFWVDGNALNDDGEPVFNALRNAAQRLTAGGVDLEPGTPAGDLMIEVVDVSRSLATDAVNAAIDLSPQKGAKAARELARAEAHAAAGRWNDAINDFRKAWKTAV